MFQVLGTQLVRVSTVLGFGLLHSVGRGKTLLLPCWERGARCSAKPPSSLRAQESLTTEGTASQEGSRPSEESTEKAPLLVGCRVGEIDGPIISDYKSVRFQRCLQRPRDGCCVLWNGSSRAHRHPQAPSPGTSCGLTKKGGLVGEPEGDSEGQESAEAPRKGTHLTGFPSDLVPQSKHIESGRTLTP